LVNEYEIDFFCNAYAKRIQRSKQIPNKFSYRRQEEGIGMAYMSRVLISVDIKSEQY